VDSPENADHKNAVVVSIWVHYPFYLSISLNNIRLQGSHSRYIDFYGLYNILNRTWAASPLNVIVAR